MDSNGASSSTSKNNLRLGFPAVVCISANNSLTDAVILARVSLYSGLIRRSRPTPSSLVRTNETGKDVFAIFGIVGDLLGDEDGTVEGILEGWIEGKLVGLAEGIRDGLLDGDIEGCAEGRSERVVEGFPDGDKEGCVEGRSD